MMTRARLLTTTFLLTACAGRHDLKKTVVPPPSSGGSDLVEAAPAPPVPTAAEAEAAPAPAPVPVAPPLPTVDAALLTGARPIKPDKRHTVNATAVGPAVTATLVQKLARGGGNEVRGFDLLLVLSGKTTLAVDLGPLGDMMEEAASNAPDGTLLAIAPNIDLTASADNGGLPALKTRSPLLYRTQFHIPGASDDLAITQEGDALVVWYFSRDEGAKPSSAWTKLATIALAKGAKVTAK